MGNRATRTGRASLLLSIVACVAFAHAETRSESQSQQSQTLTYSIDAGVGETDNVALAHEDKISQTIAVTDFDVDYREKSQRLDVDAKGNFSYLDYLQHAYDSQLLGRFDGNAEVALIPQRLTWALQDSFGQAAIDPFTPTVPTNLENINTVTTGPDLHLRLGGASFVDMSARVARAQFQSSPFSNDRILGSVALGRGLSSLSSVSVNVDSERVLFDNTVLNRDFNRSNVFVRYEDQGARTEISTDLGATVVGDSIGSTTGSLAKFKLARRLSASARITLSLGHVYTDGSASFTGLQGGATGLVGTAPATNSSQNYASDYGSVGWEFQRNRTKLAVSGRWERDRYPGQPTLDRTLTSGELRAQRQLTRAFALQFTGRLYGSDYGNATSIATNGSPNTTTTTFAAGVIWRHGRALEVKLAYEHTGYTTSPNDTRYRENRLFLTVGYRPFRGKTVDEEVPGTL